MKKTTFILSIILFILIVNSTFVNATIHKTNPITILSNTKDKTNPDWNDGQFTGNWIDDETGEIGSIKGILNLGRNPSVGTISGSTYDKNNTIKNYFNGYFYQKFVCGLVNNTTQKIVFFGKISFSNLYNFEAYIQTLNKETYQISGSFNYSFLPQLTGPYHIGIKNIHLIDTNREEKYTMDNTNDFREMMIRIWYPIEKQSYILPENYMDYSTFQWLKNRSPIPLITIPNNAYTYVHPHHFHNQMIINNETQFPLIIFSPGYDGNYEIYTSFIEDVVSNGFIVTSINHPYISGVTVFPDGRKVYAESVQSFSLQTVVDDVYFVLDYMFDLNESDEMLDGKINTENIGLYGHSFGGAATLQCLTEDDRFKAGLTLDGAFYSDLIPESFDKPFMMQLAENSFASNTTNLLWDVIESEGYKIIITGSSHYAFTDVGLLLNHLLPAIPPNLLGFGTINPKRMVNITRSLVLSFFQVYLQQYPLQHLLNMLSEFDEINSEIKL